ncbi:MAG: hypothetical protein DRP06_01880 [Candidatus Aenigmatarchaeota archaeon]|nr:MAG: hypothetical protein DRP06_01880 [Candidatus Aenigmarchaeota archaeon]
MGAEICQGARLGDISSAKIKEFVNKSNLKYISVENSLKNFGLIKSDKLLNTTVILFGKKPEKIFPNAKLRCAVFERTDSAYIIDRHEFEGDLFYLIRKAEEYILQNIHIGMKLEGLYRVDVPEIDKSAFGEAIINAFCHRDYYESDSVNIAVFKDRVEIKNPGGLYDGLTIKQIKKEIISKRRNELIANMFRRIHFIEKRGRGIRLILSKEPNADFKEIGTQFITVFKRKNYLEKGVEKLSEKEKTIIDLIRKNPKISKQKLCIKGKLSKKSVESNIIKLKEKGLLERVGPDKGGYWEVLEKVAGI